jgi:hypothetical protein
LSTRQSKRGSRSGTDIETGPIPSMRCLTQSPAGPPRVSLFEDLIHWSLKYPWFPPSNTQNASLENALVFVQPLLHIACAEWFIMCEYIKTRLGQIEWELGFPSQFSRDTEAIDVSLKRLHTWRRLIPLYRDMLTGPLETLFPLRPKPEILPVRLTSNITL